MIATMSIHQLAFDALTAVRSNTTLTASQFLALLARIEKAQAQGDTQELTSIMINNQEKR